MKYHAIIISKEDQSKLVVLAPTNVEKQLFEATKKRCEDKGYNVHKSEPVVCKSLKQLEEQLDEICI